MEKVEGQEKRDYDMLFSIRRSVRYHHRRAGFFSSLHRIAMFVSLFGAMMAGVLAIQEFGFIALILGIVVALAATTDATFDSARNCGLHMLLAYRFQELEKSFDSEGTLSKEEYKDVKNAKLEIEQEEPPPLRLLDVICHYELLRSMGHHRDRMPKIVLWRKCAKHFLSQTEYAQRLKTET